MPRAAVLALIAALCFAGCGGDDVDETVSDAQTLAESVGTAAEQRAESVADEAEEGAGNVAEEVEGAVSGADCEAATTDILTPISNRLTVQGGRLRNGYYVESEERKGIYFVSAELDGQGLEGDGDVATWVTASPGGAGAIYALDDLARKHSGYRDARKAIRGVSLDDDAAVASRDCAGG